MLLLLLHTESAEGGDVSSSGRVTKVSASSSEPTRAAPVRSCFLHCSVCDWLKTSTLGPGLRHDKIRSRANLVGYYLVFSDIPYTNTDVGISIGFKVSASAVGSYTDACYYTRSFTYLTSSDY